jgi:hypothetical protein
MDVLKKTCLQSTTISQTKDLLLKKGYYYDEVDTSEQAPLSSILSTSQQSCSKRVRCTVSLPKHYYTPGELVSIDVSILNEASITLDKILVELISIEEYDATGRGKDCKTVIRETRQMVRKFQDFISAFCKKPLNYFFASYHYLKINPQF